MLSYPIQLPDHGLPCTRHRDHPDPYCTRCGSHIPEGSRTYIVFRTLRPMLLFCNHTCFMRLRNSAAAATSQP